MPDSANISARVPVYYRWVVERLVGRRFKNKSDAVTQMMAHWIDAHREWLENNDLGIRDFDVPRAVEAADSTRVVSAESRGRSLRK